MRFLRQSTSIKVVIGPFVDVTDGATAETGVDISTADTAEIMKHDAAAVTDISGNTWAAVSGNDGFFNLTLSTTDTNTLGMLTICITDVSVCRPVFAEFMVIPSQVYDSFILGSDLLQVDADQIDGSADAANKLKQSIDGNTLVTIATGGTTTSIPTSNLTEATDDHYNGLVCKFLTGALAGQVGVVSDYDGTTKTLTLSEAVTEAPSNGDTAVLV